MSNASRTVSLSDEWGVDRHDRRDSKSLQAGETPALPANSVSALPYSLFHRILEKNPRSTPKPLSDKTDPPKVALSPSATAGQGEQIKGVDF